jgi:hypothetical protein
MDSFDNYEYLNDSLIDPELKCVCCMLPFQSPMSGPCGHTFCQQCIHRWITSRSTCPTCRNQISSDDFRPISTRIVINQLDRLLVRCKRCSQTNIPRGDVNAHEKQCPKQIVSCPAFDIKCLWKGTRSTLPTHLEECSFQKIRPVINDLYDHLKDIYEPLLDELQNLREQLEMQRRQSQAQHRFLLSVFNHGKPMTAQCSGRRVLCVLQQSRLNVTLSPTEEQGRHICTNCQKDVRPTDISLHYCEGGAICRTCLEKYGKIDTTHEKLTSTS